MFSQENPKSTVTGGEMRFHDATSQLSAAIVRE